MRMPVWASEVLAVKCRFLMSSKSMKRNNLGLPIVFIPGITVMLFITRRWQRAGQLLIFLAPMFTYFPPVAES